MDSVADWFEESRTIVVSLYYSNFRRFRWPLAPWKSFVDRFPVFFSMESDCPPGELTPTFVYCDSADRGLFHYITHLRHYEHFLRRLSGFYFVYAAIRQRSKCYGATACVFRIGHEPQVPGLFPSQRFGRILEQASNFHAPFHRSEAPSAQQNRPLGLGETNRIGRTRGL